LFEGIDEYCKRIFWYLFLSENACRFNYLYRSLNKINVKLSKPTLIAHLGHLQDRGLIVRREEDKQNVSYVVNWENLDYLKESIGYKQRLRISNENKDRFKSLPPREQLATLLDILLLSELHRLKGSILDLIEPEKKTENHFAYWFVYKNLDLYTSSFLEMFMKADKKCQKMLLEKIDGSIKLMRNDLFTFEEVDVKG
jgi:hypothetical protein